MIGYLQDYLTMITTNTQQWNGFNLLVLQHRIHRVFDRLILTRDRVNERNGNGTRRVLRCRMLQIIRQRGKKESRLNRLLRLLLATCHITQLSYISFFVIFTYFRISDRCFFSERLIATACFSFSSSFPTRCCESLQQATTTL